MLRKIGINFFLIISLAICSHALLDKNDEALENYLKDIMESYQTYLVQNNVDPTDAEPNPLVLESDAESKIFLHCELTDRKITGYSTSTNQTFKTSSHFPGHTFGVKRVLREPLWFMGKYDCSGSVNEPEEDRLTFNGNGTYMIQANSSDETVIFRNVGDTEDHKLDMSLLKFDYKFDLKFSKTVLGGGMWNDLRVEKIISNIEQEFQDTYNRYLSYGPTFPLMMYYVYNKTLDLDLTTLVDANDLPAPYIPVEPSTINPITTDQIEIETSTESSPATSSDGDGISQSLVQRATDSSESRSRDNTETTTERVLDITIAMNPETTTARKPETTTKRVPETTTARKPETTRTRKPETTTTRKPETNTVRLSKTTANGANNPLRVNVGTTVGIALLVALLQ